MRFLLLFLVVIKLAHSADFDSRSLARELIIKKEIKDMNRPVDPSAPVYDFMNKSKIILAFNIKYLPLIKQNGFLNQFQVDHSVNMDRKHRMLVEDQIIESKLKRSGSKNAKEHYLRPKYAFLTLDLDANDKSYQEFNGQFGIHITSDYGQIYAKIKDDVKERSTFTAGDSLYIFGSKTGDARTFKSTQTTPKGAYYYWEAQIWGELSLSDVDYVLVNCKNERGSIEKVSAEEVQQLKDSGLEVFECLSQFENPNYSFGRYRLDQGKQL